MSLAVVTGGTRGIGAAICQRLVTGGYQVVAMATRLPATPVPGVHIEVCDVSDPDAVAAVFQAVGPVEVLVNNAGVSTSAPVLRTTVEQWQHNHAVNATGPFLCSQAVLENMLARSFGRIVTVASTAGLAGAKYIAAYAASKHAVLGLMRSIAAEVEGTGVTANTVCPTYVRTDMTVATIARIAERTGVTLAVAEATLAQQTPHGRIIEVAEVADAVMHLIDSSHNGQEILLDGGPS